MATGNDYLEVDFVTGNDAEKDILLAQLAEIGFEGFEEEKNLLKAFIILSEFDKEKLHEITGTAGITYTSSVIKYKNWNETWEKGFQPVVVNNFCAVRAIFHHPVEGVQYEIIITPKMSFGTGHHATTYLMIEAMSAIKVEGVSVFDLGTGTGILAILAEKMGASQIEAIDIDDWSIENGIENIRQNGCTKIHLYKAERMAMQGRYDIILANVNRNVILDQLAEMKARLQPGGTLVLSGLLTGDAAVVCAAATTLQLKLLAIKERNSWVCLRFGNQED